MEISGVAVHSPTITLYTRNSLKAVPRNRMFCGQQPPGDDIAFHGDTLQQAAPPETIVVATEAVILKENSEGRGMVESLAEQSIIGSYTVGTEKEDGEATGPVVVIEFVIPLQYLQEPKGSGGDGGEPMTVLRSLAIMKLG